eukprot:3386512-Prorocentrum_lima.AAC.1
MPLHAPGPGTRLPPTSPAPHGPSHASPAGATERAAPRPPRPPRWKGRRSSPTPGSALPRAVSL